MFLYFGILLLFLIDVSNSNLVIDNDVSTSPEVHCNVDSINVIFKTQKPFNGRVYVDGESYDKNCVKNFGQYNNENSFDSVDGFDFKIPFGACNMRRQRTLSPRGVSFSFSVIVSFHPFFVTSNDKAFKVKCFFMEAVKAVDVGMEVNKLTTQVIENTFHLPQCSYSLRHSIDGGPLDFANVGQPVTHVWQCDRIAGFVYEMLIHSCYVDDGNGNKFELVDNKGCAVDHYLLSDLQYDPISFTAYSNTHVFKYADRVQLFFTCTVQLCFKDDGGCNGVTPPVCSNKQLLPGIVDESYNNNNKLNNIKPPIAHINLPNTEVVKPFFENILPPSKISENGNVEKELHDLSTPSHPSQIPSFEEFKARVLKPPSPLNGPISLYKDSPIIVAENTTTLDSKTIDLKIFNETNKPKRSPLSKNNDDQFLKSKNSMEADLSVSLTVLPITNPTSTFDNLIKLSEKESTIKNDRYCLSSITIILYILLEFFTLTISVTIIIVFLLKKSKTKSKSSTIEAFN
ncbi:Zona pellucida domain-containing protein [Strongyloides ratti]|uniref:Zona pellucida domain-containing protein n=1 Tax=Strongyloides ratti TaxID=34506 RepID=A0A090LGG5_STRRB|nr:Zona pellucida domain-containing protein [Strongyloides ratti]CEF66615.1 Zona pellucida domain-containing protein [Strongyloides ratti]